MGISIAILIVLFSIQRFGTRWVGYAFSPVILLWFLFNAIIGIYNIAKFDPRVFRAISPSHWFLYFLRNGRGGWKTLGGVVLCVTGGRLLLLLACEGGCRGRWEQRCCCQCTVCTHTARCCTASQVGGSAATVAIATSSYGARSAPVYCCFLQTARTAQ